MYKVEIYGASDDLIEVLGVGFGPHDAYEFITNIADKPYVASVLLVFKPLNIIEVSYESGCWRLTLLYKDVFTQANITKPMSGDYSDNIVLLDDEPIILSDIFEIKNRNALPVSIAENDPFFRGEHLDPVVFQRRLNIIRQQNYGLEGYGLKGYGVADSAGVS